MFFFFFLSEYSLTRWIAMKLVIATIYSRYETSIIDDERMAETEETYGQVEGDKLVLKFSVAA